MKRRFLNDETIQPIFKEIRNNRHPRFAHTARDIEIDYDPKNFQPDTG